MKDLYQKLLDNTTDEDYKSGICSCISKLSRRNIISHDEYWDLFNDFRTRIPKRFSKFWWNSSFIGGNYWWLPSPKGIKQRRLFIQHIIKSYEKK
jgi:hypothetical protein